MKQRLTPFARVKRHLRKFEFVRNRILPIYWKARYIRRRLAQTAALATRPAALPPPDRRYWLDPKRVAHHTNLAPDDHPRVDDRVFDTTADRGKVHGGDWDLSDHRFDELEVFAAFEARIKGGKEWAETAWYREMLGEIEQGFVRFNCTSKEELDGRCSYLDSLIESIRANGYKENYAVVLPEEAGKPPKDIHTSDEVTVNIGRNGEYLFQDGRHRLCAARLLGVEKIPVQVLVRHREWARLREELLMYAREAGGELYQPGMHPDLEDIPATHDGVDRFEAMKDSLDFTSGALLDVGANMGYFCHMFEEVGFDCFAVEYDPIFAAPAERIRLAEGRRFTLAAGDILDPRLWGKIGRPFEVVLVLNVLHHFLKTEELFKAMTRWLNSLESKVIFFEPHLPSERQMQGVFLNYEPAEFVEYIMKNTGKSNAEEILKAEDGRTVFKLT